MAIQTYLQLQDALRDMLAQPDAPVATFIAQCEADFRSVRHRIMERTLRVSMSANSGAIALPQDFLELRSVSHNGKSLKPVSIHNASRDHGDLGYWISGTTLHVTPIQQQGERLLVTYFAKITPLSETNTSNWLLLEFPMAYLHGSLMHAYEWSRDVKGENASRSRFAEAMAQLSQDSRRSQYGGNTPIGVL